MKGEQYLHGKMHFSSISPVSFSSAHAAPQLGTDTSSRQAVKSPLTTLSAERGGFQHRRVHPCQDTAQGTRHIPAPRPGWQQQHTRESPGLPQLARTHRPRQLLGIFPMFVKEK